MRTLTIFSALAASLVLATPLGATASATSVTSHASKYGRVLFDGRGFALYAFTADARGRSTCTGDCARNWPPYIVKGAGSAGRGTRSGLLGTTTRRDGSRQLTYAGHPLYYYVGDRKAGQILCQNVSEFGGLWLVVRPNGGLVR
jgi:predicted lipoprotein with Yx(FWY)xxD motif